MGMALSGGALWLADEIDDGDATRILEAKDELRIRADNYDQCAENLVIDILANSNCQGVGE